MEAGDLLQEVSDYNASRAGYEVAPVLEEHSGGSGSGGGVAMILIAGVVVFIALYGK